MDVDVEALRGAFAFVPLQQLVDGTVEQAQDDIRRLCAELSAASDADRKRELLMHLHRTRQRLLRLHVLASWSHRSTVLHLLASILDTAKGHADALRVAADHLAYLHEELEDMRAPAYDIPTAIQILQTGSYDLLPQVIETCCGPQIPPAGVKRLAATQLLDHLLHVQLLSEGLPQGVTFVGVEGGFAILRSENSSWQAKLTLRLGPAHPPQPADENVAAPVQASTQPQHVKPEPAAPEFQAAGSQEDAAMPDVGADQGAGAGQDVTMADAEQAKRSADSQFSTDGPDKWRWHVDSLDILPGSDLGPHLAPHQTSELCTHLNMLLWQAAEPISSQSTDGQPSEPAADNQNASDGPDSKPETAADVNMTPAPGASFSQGSKSGTSAREQESEHVALTTVKPLVVLHIKLRQIGARVAYASMLSWVARQADNPSSRWHKQIARGERSKGSKLEQGMRVRYWQQAPWLSPQEAAAVSPATPDQPGIPAGPLAAQAASKPAQHIMEVGHPGDGTLTAVHMPALPGDAPAEADGRRQPSEDVLAVSMEDLLLRAAANNARVQLGAMAAVLQRHASLAKLHGQAHLVTPGGSSSPSAKEAPRLEVQLDGQCVLQVAIQLHTGLLLLTPGTALGAAADSEPIASLAGEEAKLRQLQASALSNSLARLPSERGLSPGRLAVERAAAFVAERACSHALQARRTRLLDAVHHLDLTPLPSAAIAGGSSHASRAVPLPLALLGSYWQAHPLAPRCSTSYVQTLAFSPTPSLPSSPATDPSARLGTAASDAGLYSSVPRGVAYYLLAAMSTDGYSSFFLLGCLCDSLGTPCQVVCWTAVPKLPAQSMSNNGETIEAEQPAASPPSANGNGSLARGSSLGKRKREDDAGEEDAVDQTEISKPSSSEPGQDRKDSPAHLQQVVDWCRHHMLLSQLQLHLQALGMQYQQVLPSSPSPPPSSSVEPPAASGTPPLAAPAHPRSPATQAQPALELECSQALQQLDDLAAAKGCLSQHSDARSADPAVRQPLPCGIWLKPDDSSAEARGRWSMAVHSRYLAQLPHSCAHAADSVPLAPKDAHITRQPAGLHLQYNFEQGGMPQDALTDLYRVTRLHSCLARAQHLMFSQQPSQQSPSSAGPCQAEASPPKQLHKAQQIQVKLLNGKTVPPAALSLNADAATQSASTPQQQPQLQPASSFQPSWRVLDTAYVQITAAGPTQAVLSVFPLPRPPAEEAPDSKADAAAEPVGQPQSEIRPVSHGSRRPSFSNHLTARFTFSNNSSGPLQSLLSGLGQLDSFSNFGSVWDRHDGLLPQDAFAQVRGFEPSAPAAPESPFESLAAVKGSAEQAEQQQQQQPVLQVGLAWVNGRLDGAVCRGEVRCRLQLPPEVPAAVTESLQAMAEAGEEELLLDALCICAEPLAAIAAALHPLQAAWPPDDVSFTAPDPPYQLQITCKLHKNPAHRLVLDVRLCAGTLAWLGISLCHVDWPGEALPHVEGVSLGGMKADLLKLPEMYASEDLEPAFRTGKGLEGVRGVWMRGEGLQAALELILAGLYTHDQ